MSIQELNQEANNRIYSIVPWNQENAARTINANAVDGIMPGFEELLEETADEMTAGLSLMPENRANEKPQNDLSLKQFLQDFGDSLLQAVRTQNPPLFKGEVKSARTAVLESLKRQLFAAQAKTVHAVTQLLLDKNESAAIINAEMGTGKTCMGIATAVLLHAAGLTRTLVLCPPHLVYKWRREILATVNNAKVVVLNGADTLKKLQALRGEIHTKPTQPTFFVMGRVRLRMGHHWQVVTVPRRVYGKSALFFKADDDHPASQGLHRRTVLASCPDCGSFIKNADDTYLLWESTPTDKKLRCDKCQAPLWQLTHPHEPRSLTEQVQQGLQQLPGIGYQKAEKLIAQFGENLLASLLGDNLHQLVQLLDENGEFVFSDSQATKMERALSHSDIAFGQAGYQASEFIKRYLPKKFFSLLIADEAHEYKNSGSAQGQAMGVLASCVKKVLLLTGTLMGGYADDLFYLLWRVLPQKMMEDNYRYSKRGSLSAAANSFMETHGVLKQIYKITEEREHLTARGKQQTEHTLKAPGFGPVGLARYVLPYTAFLKLQDLGNHALPSYQERFIHAVMTDEQELAYQRLEIILRTELREALKKGNQALLGVVLNVLLAWPDCAFRDEIVIHPHTKRKLIHMPAVLTETAAPKEAKMLELCLDAKRNGRRTLVYTLYTGKRDTTARLKNLLEQAGLKTAVLRSSVQTQQREAWIAEQTDRGIDVLLCHPELVKTGLDLLAFPTIVFLQSGYNVYTLMQATRRSWRIGQTYPVEVYFLGYEKTAQIQCLQLMAKKIAVSQSTSGKMPDCGLDILNSDGESIEVALARQLVKQ